MKIPKALHEICTAIHDEGGRPLIVGGAARDAVMGMKPKDFDVEVFHLRVRDLLVILERFGKVNTVGVSFGIIKLTVGGDEFDFSVPRRDSKVADGHRGFIVTADATLTPFEAAKRRDFTMNTLAFDPITGEFVDTHGAIADIEEGMLVPTSEAFVEDPLRVLRGMQFAARFDLKLHDPKGLFKKAAAEFGSIAKDRIRIEFEKLLLKGKRPSAGFKVLVDAGVISLFPRIAALIGVPQDPIWHPEGWSLFKAFTLSCDPVLANPAVSVGIDLDTVIRHGTSEFAARNAAIESFSSASGASPIVDIAPVSFLATHSARTLSFSSAGKDGITVITGTETFMRFFGTTAHFTDEVIRVMFKIPQSRMKSIVDSAVDDFKIIRMIVGFVSIQMVNMLPAFDGTTVFDLCDNAVDANSPVSAGLRRVLVTSIVMNSRPSAVDGDVFVSLDLGVVTDVNVGHNSLRCGEVDIHHCIMEIGDVFTHTMHVLDAGARQCDRDGIEGEERIVRLLADLCHDFGKVERTIFKDGRWRAPAHEAAGEQPTIDFLRSIGFGERIIDQVVPLVTSHMQHIGFGDGDPRRFVRRLATRVDITRMAHVVEADHSGRPPLAAHMPEQMVQILKVKAEMDAEGDTVKPILMGRHLIEMGMKPSRRFSEILAAAHEAQIEGVFSDVAGAMEFVKPMVAG